MKFKIISLKRALELKPEMTHDSQQLIQALQDKEFTKVSFDGNYLMTIKDDNERTFQLPLGFILDVNEIRLEIIDNIDEVISFLSSRVSVSMYPDVKGAERDLLRKIIKARKYVESL